MERLTWLGWLIIGLLLLISGVGGTGIGHWMLFDELPEPVTQQVWIPENARVESSSDVNPGTFTVDITLEQLQQTTTDQKFLVVYCDKYCTGSPFLEYFREADLPSTFDYLKYKPPYIDQPFWAGMYTEWPNTYDKEESTFRYTPRKAFWPLALSALLIIFGFTGLTATVINIRKSIKVMRGTPLVFPDY